MLWDFLVALVGIIAAAGTVSWIAWLRTTVAQKRHEAELAQGQMEHAERMAMIERGITPPSVKDLGAPKDKNLRAAYMNLARIGTVAPVFAWLSNMKVAWIAVAIIGTVAAIGTIIVYVGSLNDGSEDPDESDDTEVVAATPTAEPSPSEPATSTSTTTEPSAHGPSSSEPAPTD